MNKEAKIISVEIKDNITYVTCEYNYGHNVTAELYLSPGDDSVPQKDDFTTLVKVEGKGKYIAVGILNNSEGIEKGEKRLYSRDANGAEQSEIHLKNDGTIVINNGTDFLVRYNELETAFNQLKQDFDDFVSTVYGVHIHPAVTTATVGIGPVGVVTISPTTSTGSPSTADITPAKVDDVNVQGVGE